MSNVFQILASVNYNYDKAMSYVSEFSQSQEYLSFRSSIPLRRIVVDADSSKVYKNKINIDYIVSLLTRLVMLLLIRYNVFNKLELDHKLY
jgi:hypothetical protein